ncbi:MAG: PucR family transcriptional regulator ligand-binding domain-containing protein [Bacillota bacterium]
MRFTVKEALEMEIFQKCRLLTGKGGLQNKIRWVNILEILDDLSHIEAGEFLITTAHGFNVQDKRMQRSMIELFASRKLAAVAIQTGHYIKEIPPSFIRFAEEYDIPLIEIPPDHSFKSITRSLMNELVSYGKPVGETRTQDYSNFLLESQLNEMKKLWNNLFTSELPESLHVELERYGIKSREPLVVLELSINRGEKEQADSRGSSGSSLMAQTEKTLAGILMQRHINFLVGPYEKHLLLLVQSNQLTRPTKNHDRATWDLVFVSKLLDELQLLFPGCEILIGASNIRNHIGELNTACYEAGKALYAAKLGLFDGSRLVSYKNLGLYRLIMDVKNIETLKELYFATIDPLLKYDRDNRGSLLETLKVYLKHFNIKKASEEIFVHRHTMRYRLRQIESLTGYNPLIPSDTVQLNLGLQIYYYLERLNLLE